jgi:uncharacterized protein YcfL
MRQSITACTWVVLALGLAACSTVNRVEPQVSRAEPEVVNDRRIVTDEDLARAAAITQVVESTTDDLLRVQVQLDNRTDELHRIQYRFDWFDAEGMRVESPMSVWRPKTLFGGEQVWVSGTAPAPGVVDFKLQLIEP